MNHRLFALPLLLATALLASACGKSSLKDQISTSTGSRLLAEDIRAITIRDTSGAVVKNAKIMIGMKENVPFAGNILTTDASGQIVIPSAWTDAQPITVVAPGYVRATFFSQEPGALNLTLNFVPSEKAFEIKGDTTGYPNLANDGFVDVGLVFPTISRGRMASLQVTSLISLETDTMKVIGKSFQIPSNISVPTQTETYILPVSLSKPSYRVYVPAQGDYKVASIHARFPLKKLIDEVQDGTSIADLINQFTFVGASVKSVNVKNVTTAAPLTVNGNALSPNFEVTAPNFDSNLTMLAAAAPDAGGSYYLTDAKRVMPKQKMKLQAPNGTLATGLVVSLLTNELPALREGLTGPKGETYSSVITPASKSDGFEFLELVDGPKVSAGSLILDPPRKIGGVDAALTYAILSKVEAIDKGSFKLEKKTPQWELYASDWAARLDLPDFPGDATKPSTSGMRWEASFGGVPASTPKAAPGPQALEKVTHVSHNATDL